MHQNRRFVHGSAILGLCVSCGAPGPVTPGGEVQTQLAGLVSLEGPVSGARVRVVAAEDGASTFGEGRSDEAGAFTAELGPLYGSVRLLATVEGSEGLEALWEAAQGTTASGVQVSPLTTLHAAWVRGALQRGEDRARALARANELVFGHFGGLDHARIAPADLRGDAAAVADDPVRAGLFMHGLAEQAQRMSRRSQGQGAGPVTLLALVAAYGRDLEDGLADGLDRFGAPISTGAVRLTPDSLRLDLAMALGAFLDGPRNGSLLRASDVGELLQALREADGPLFPEGSLADRDEKGPELQITWRRGGLRLEPNTAVTGGVELVVHAEDPAGIAALRASIMGPPESLLGEDVWQDRVVWPVDTADLQDGLHIVEVTARDGLGFVSTATSSLWVDHTAPTVTLEAPSMTTTPTVAVRGRWFDMNGVAQVVLRVDGEERVVLEAPPERFEATVPLGCRGGRTVVVEAVAQDTAGNLSEAAHVSIQCVGEAPTLVLLPSSVIDEREATFEHGPDGALIRVLFPPSPQRSVLDEQSVWPVRVFKLFSRLDRGADNLPTFRWHAAGEGAVAVRFRTFVDGAPARPWASLEMGAGGRADLPVNFETFGPELATAGADAVHAAEVEVTDGQGGRAVRRVELQLELLSPPVWVGNCTVTVTPATLRAGFENQATTQLRTADLVWDTGVPPLSLSPVGQARLRWDFEAMGAEVAVLGEDTWTAPAFDPSRVPSVACWNQHSNEAYLHEVQQGPGQGLCGGERYPSETLDAFVAGRDGRLSQTSALAQIVSMARMGLPLAPDGQGWFVVAPYASHQAVLGMEQPVLRMPDGGPYSWPTSIQVPAGYASSVQAQGRARYPVATLERTGTDYRLHVPYGGRPFVTRTFVRTVRLMMPEPRAEAHLSLLGTEVPVTFDATCAAAQNLEIQL